MDEDGSQCHQPHVCASGSHVGSIGTEAVAAAARTARVCAFVAAAISEVR